MGPFTETRATLRFHGSDLDPDEVTRLLGKAPTDTGRKGDLLRPDRPDRIAKQGRWRLEAPDSISGNLEAQITEILAGATKDLSIWQALSVAYRGNIFCGLFLNSQNEGLSLSPSVLFALAERGLALDLDIYGHDNS